MAKKCNYCNSTESFNFYCYRTIKLNFSQSLCHTAISQLQGSPLTPLGASASTLVRTPTFKYETYAYDAHIIFIERKTIKVIGDHSFYYHTKETLYVIIQLCS